MKSLKIIGSGVRGALHLTVESLQQLAKAQKILWVGTVEGFPELVLKKKWLGEDITSYYQNGALDSDNYGDIKSKVLNELNCFESVALVVLGHPRLGVSIVQEFQLAAKAYSIKLEVYPGISSFDTMFNDLGLDPIEEGSSLVDANRLILYDYFMDTCLNYFIYHVCSIGNSSTDYEFPARNNLVSFLKRKLLKHYPEDHETILLTSGTSVSTESIQQKGTIKDLDILLKEVTFKSSLYIPALLPVAERVNSEFYNLLIDQYQNSKNKMVNALDR
jgi:uncharacterized protein YabN with tetrapyrrole methylase and pyrophosphatase domain